VVAVDYGGENIERNMEFMAMIIATVNAIKRRKTMDDFWVFFGLALLVLAVFGGPMMIMSISESNASKAKMEQEVKMAEAGMEQVINSVTKSEGAIETTVLWKKVK